VKTQYTTTVCICQCNLTVTKGNRIFNHIDLVRSLTAKSLYAVQLICKHTTYSKLNYFTFSRLLESCRAEHFGNSYCNSDVHRARQYCLDLLDFTLSEPWRWSIHTSDRNSSKKELFTTCVIYSAIFNLCIFFY